MTSQRVVLLKRVLAPAAVMTEVGKKSKAVGKPVRASDRITKLKLFVEFPVCNQLQPKTSSSSRPPALTFPAVGMRRTLSTSVALTCVVAAVCMALERWLGVSRANIPPPHPGLRSDLVANSGDTRLGLGLWEQQLQAASFLMNHHVLTLEVFAFNKYLLLTVSICC